LDLPTKMPLQTGSLDNAGHPVINIEVYGVVPQLKREFEAMIDTGFTGFLMLPIVDAFPLGLVLYGTSNWTLADGRSSPKLLAYGTVLVGKKETHGVVVLEAGPCRPLLGIDFLRKSGKTLVVNELVVILWDTAEILKLAEESKKAREKPSTEPPAT